MIFFSQWNEEHFKVFQKLRHDIFMIFRKKNSLTDSVRFNKKKCNVWCILVGCIRLSTHATVFRSDNIRIHYITARNHLFTCYIIWKPGVISVQGISSYWSLIAKEKKIVRFRKNTTSNQFSCSQWRNSSYG